MAMKVGSISHSVRIALDANVYFLHSSPFGSHVRSRFPLQLHEQTQRFILLLIFYLLGPVLTFGIIGGLVLRKLPVNARTWERSLTQHTGLHWKIGSVEYRSPNFTRLHNIEILDETAQRPVFRAAQIDIQRITSASREKIFPGIQADSSAVHSAGLTAALEGAFPFIRTSDQFWQITVPVSIVDLGTHSRRDDSCEDSALLVQHLLRKVSTRFSTLAEVPVQLVLERIGLRSRHSLQRGEDQLDIFYAVQGNIYRTPTEIRSDWSFQIRGISDLDWEHRERLSFSLSLTDMFEVSFQSGRQPIPCDLAAVFCTAFKHFSGGSFQGKFSHSIRSGRAETQTTRLEQVIFRNVPLTPLVQPYTPFTVEGTVADLQFFQATFGAEGIDAKGCLQVLNGAVAQPLFHHCVDKFNLTIDQPRLLESPDPMIPFSACVIHFHLQPDGIDFWADQRWRHAIMHYQEDPLSASVYTVFLPPNRRLVSYPELMSIFAPDNAPMIPLTLGTQSLLPHIPVQ